MKNSYKDTKLFISVKSLEVIIFFIIRNTYLFATIVSTRERNNYDAAIYNNAARVTEPNSDRYTTIRPLLRESFYDTMVENPLVTHSNGDITSGRGPS